MPAEPGVDAPPSTTRTVADLGEPEIIALVRRRMGAPSASVAVGIGDDAAVVEPDRGTLTVATTDCVVEGVHFDRAFCPPDAVGHKALAVNLSDLAAMGATPRHALLSLVLPASFPVPDLEALLGGLAGLATRHRVDVIGGNVARSHGPLVVDVTALGSVRRRRVLTRSGAQAGDLLYVSGDVGAGAAGLGSLRAPGAHTRSEEMEACHERYLRPEPRVRLGMMLGRNRAARACVDLSDGLADAVHQLAEASRLGAVLDAEALPIPTGARRWFERAGQDPVVAALSGGDDYELLFAAPPAWARRLEATRRRSGKPRLTRIGRLVAGSTCVIERNGTPIPLPAGYTHFPVSRGA